jgi:hypothetical protein
MTAGVSVHTAWGSPAGNGRGCPRALAGLQGPVVNGFVNALRRTRRYETSPPSERTRRNGWSARIWRDRRTRSGIVPGELENRCRHLILATVSNQLAGWVRAGHGMVTDVAEPGDTRCLCLDGPFTFVLLSGTKRGQPGPGGTGWGRVQVRPRGGLRFFARRRSPAFTADRLVSGRLRRPVRLRAGQRLPDPDQTGKRRKC